MLLWRVNGNYEAPGTQHFLFYFIFFWSFLGPLPQHVEVPRLEVSSELYPTVHTTATAMPDPNHICDLHHSSWQLWIPDPLIEARNGTHILMDTSWVC